MGYKCLLGQKTAFCRLFNITVGFVKFTNLLKKQTGFCNRACISETDQVACFFERCVQLHCLVLTGVFYKNVFPLTVCQSGQFLSADIAVG